MAKLSPKKVPQPAPQPAPQPNPATASKPVPVAPTTADTGFKFFSAPIPPRTRPGNSMTGALTQKLSACPAGQAFVETIDGDYSKEEFSELARKLSNRISGAIRRYRLHNPSAEFTMRTVNDETFGRGVAVWKVADAS